MSPYWNVGGTGCDFLLTEAELGITFAQIALDERRLSGGDQAKIARNTENALIAFEAIARFRGRVAATGVDLSHLNTLVSELTGLLRSLGAIV